MDQAVVLELPSLIPALPEILLCFGAMALLMLGAFRGPGSVGLITGVSIGLVLAAAVLVQLLPADMVTFGGSFVLDPFARFMKTLTLLGAALGLVLSIDYIRTKRIDQFEFPILILLATAGMMIMVSANDLIAVYMGLELQSLALYVLASIRRDSARATEAGLKYFVLGALSSGMLLYGCSLIYGFTGTISFDGISAAATDPGGMVGLVFLIVGFAFKISAVPFHWWTPDVYEGAPTPVTALFAAAPKVAAVAVFVRAMVAAFPELTPQWQMILVFISIASMALGAFAAIGQRNIKRLLAYSSIGHMGFALVGLASGSEAGVQGVVIYMAIYLAMTVGAFACVLAMRRGSSMVETIDDLAGLSRHDPLKAFLFAMLLFSLAGIPPLAGFFAKFYVFLAAIEAGLITLAVIGVLSSVVGAYYYLRIIKIMYFDEPAAPFEPMATELRGVLVVSGVFVLLFFAYPGPLVAAAGSAARSLF
ncbi:MAG: NADH-quinone oxidoreductase subunit NuoN [Pseudomonadota bacterium]